MALNVIASPLRRSAAPSTSCPPPTRTGASSHAASAKVPAALDQWVESLHSAAAKGNVAPRRQVEACIKQCSDLTADDGYFATLLDARRGRRPDRFGTR